ncbi:hypothetical protein ElyMa_002263000 [Elysia marginata]|uniref:Uncharacterized protein n=1 Tax=Elysia marginata TaxID=1093978 RepID=A0AAV4G058_9GAST|nr:hypothetical protein ElyMa_002263000 [Elysia marginata]
MQDGKKISNSGTNFAQHSLSNHSAQCAMLQRSAGASIQSHSHEENIIKRSLGAGHNIINEPHLSIMQLLLVLLYLAILWDILFILSSRYFSTWHQRRTELNKGGRRLQHYPAAAASRVVTHRNSAGKMTLDYLWRRIKAEARHLQRANNLHRTITQAMMETRLQARGQLERDRSLTKTKRLSLMTDPKIDMIRWAARISSDHDPRAK